jgi:hypothetical protein
METIVVARADGTAAKAPIHAVARTKNLIFIAYAL